MLLSGIVRSLGEIRDIVTNVFEAVEVGETGSCEDHRAAKLARNGRAKRLKLTATPERLQAMQAIFRYLP